MTGAVFLSPAAPSRTTAVQRLCERVAYLSQFRGRGGTCQLSAAVILPLMVGVLALIGGLAVSCFAKLYGVAFLGRPRSLDAERARETALPMQIAMSMLAAACVAIGVCAGHCVASAGGGHARAPAQSGAAGRRAFHIAYSAAARRLRCRSVACLGSLRWRSTKHITPTWACGLPGLDSRMQYTSTAFSKPLRKVFAQVYNRNAQLRSAMSNQPYFPKSISLSLGPNHFVRELALPSSPGRNCRACHPPAPAQTGNIQVYLLYMFLALVALLVFMRFA